jgi:hypothetical protein
MRMQAGLSGRRLGRVSLLRSFPTVSRYPRPSKREHRFDAIHQRRQIALDTQSTQGYTDGLASAKIFAAHNGSKLGFIDQYVDDSIKVLGPTVVPVGTEEKYRAGFMRGLREAEAIVRNAM